MMDTSWTLQYLDLRCKYFSLVEWVVQQVVNDLLSMHTLIFVMLLINTSTLLFLLKPFNEICFNEMSVSFWGQLLYDVLLAPLRDTTS